MKRLTALQEAIVLTKSGELEGLENLFILTRGETYYLAHSLLRAQAGAIRLLIETYVELYCRRKDLPVKAEDFYHFLEQTTLELCVNKWKVGAREMPLAYLQPGVKEWLTDEKVAVLWMMVEERLHGLDQGQETGNRLEKPIDYVISGIQIAFTISLVVAFAGVMVIGWNSVKSKRVTYLNPNQGMGLENHQISIEEELPKPGWSKKKGMLYYAKKDQTLAQGEVPMGKQILTFDQEGQLVGIKDNGSLVNQPGLCYDEDIKYEVQDGDIYRKGPGDQERVCVIRNGHITYVNVNYQSLYYICEYQVPNSERVRQVLMESNLDGTQSKELSVGVVRPDLNRLQIAGNYFYYIENGKLLRHHMEDDQVLVMASGVSQFYPKGGTVYYMKDHQMEKASSGIPYEDVKKFYRVELIDQDILLTDQSGQPVGEQDSKTVQIGDGSYQVIGGRIQEVEPAVRTFGDLSYQVGDNQKLFWKGALGISGLLPQSGQMVDGFCVADNWLYYSTRVEIPEEGPVKSQIFKINLEENQEEPVSQPFVGFISQFYYVEETKEIFGEYLPSMEADSHGRMVVIPLGGSPSFLKENKRPKGEKGQRDDLDFVMAQEGTLYVFFRSYVWDEQDAQWKPGLSLPMTLEITQREDFISE